MELDERGVAIARERRGALAAAKDRAQLRAKSRCVECAREHLRPDRRHLARKENLINNENDLRT